MECIPLSECTCTSLEAEEENALETTVFFGEKYKTGKILFGPKRNNNKHSYMWCFVTFYYADIQSTPTAQIPFIFNH